MPGTRECWATSTTRALSPGSALPTSCSTRYREGPRRPGVAIHPPRSSRRRLRAGRLSRPRQSDAEPGLWPGSTPRPGSRRTTASRTSICRPAQLLLAGQNGNSRALYDAYYGGWEPRVGFAWTPSEKWVVRGAFGIVQYMEGTGKNLRLPANPPFNFEGRRVFDLTTGAGSGGDRIRRHHSQHHRWPGHALPDLRARPAAAAHEAVEHVRRAAS